MDHQLGAAWDAVVKGEKATRKQLLDALHFAGLNPTKKVLREFCGTETEAVFTRHDLVKVAELVPALSEGELIAAFTLIDENGDGALSKAELHKSLAEHGERMTAQEIDDVLAEFDGNGDNAIDYREFTSMFLKLSEQVRAMKPPAGQKMSAKEKDSEAAKQKPKTMTLSSSAKTSLKERKGASEEREEAASSGSDAMLAQEDDIKEPKNLKEWDCDRLGGTLQVESSSGIVTSEHYTFSLSMPTEVFISLKLVRTVWTDAVDVAVFVVQTDTPDGEPKLAGVSSTHQKKDPMLRLSLNAGDYVVFPYAFGGKLRKRTGQPKKAAPLSKTTDSGFELTKESKKALGEIFARLDLDSKGSVDKHEYDMLLLRTDGEPCDDETWDYLKENFNMEDGSLKLSGFISMYEQVLAGVEGREDDFYANFEQLGYNRRLELDEAVSFRLFVFVNKTGAMSQLKSVAWDRALMEVALQQSIKAKAQKERIADKLYLYTYRDSMRLSFLVENKRDREVTVLCDCSESRNARTYRESLKFHLSVPASSAQVAHHLVPDALDEHWQVACQVSIAQ